VTIVTFPLVEAEETSQVQVVPVCVHTLLQAAASQL
jgi:hypothetical protein